MTSWKDFYIIFSLITQLCKFLYSYILQASCSGHFLIGYAVSLYIDDNNTDMDTPLFGLITHFSDKGYKEIILFYS